MHHERRTLLRISPTTPLCTKCRNTLGEVNESGPCHSENDKYWCDLMYGRDDAPRPMGCIEGKSGKCER